jgi:hypothetical protein
MASRDVGATLGAAGAARVGGYVNYDISPSRVEPHLVAVTQPRSAYCEQFRSLRTKLLQAGERKQMRAFVVTSGGVGEGKTLTALNLAWLLAQTEGVRALLIDSPALLTTLASMFQLAFQRFWVGRQGTRKQSSAWIRWDCIYCPVEKRETMLPNCFPAPRTRGF